MTNKQKKILVVEDESVLRHALEEKLERSNFEVISAKNGEEGLEKALEEKPDLILLDLIMPGKGGMHMLKELKKHPWGKDAKVIILTNLNEPDKFAEGMEHGVYEYLIKSDWKLESLIEKVREKLK